MKSVTLYSDGACSPNPGPGGWGSILEYKGTTKEFSRGYADTTNNRMELCGVIEPLRLLKEPCEVTIHSDSKYVVNAVEKGWLRKWRKNGWETSSKTTVKNKDLWELLVELQEVHQLKFCWIRGHNDHPENERCDVLAVDARLGSNLEIDEGYIKYLANLTE